MLLLECSCLSVEDQLNKATTNAESLEMAMQQGDMNEQYTLCLCFSFRWDIHFQI